MVKALVRGEPPERPLFLPIVFALGAKVENLPLGDFMSNATKIANGLRRIKAILHSDGVTCYFDPTLEARAAALLARQSPRETPTWDGLGHRQQIEVAIDVIRRLRVLAADDLVLVATVTGPLTLGGQLAAGGGSTAAAPSPATDLVELAADVTRLIASKYVEAGVDAVFIVENPAGALSAESLARWAACLTSVCNVIRFYEALPVLLLTERWFIDGPTGAAVGDLGCVLCSPIAHVDTCRQIGAATGARLGVALPPALFQHDAATFERLRPSLADTVRAAKPALLTTAGDVPLTSDLGALPHTMAALRSLASEAGADPRQAVR